MTFTDKVWTLKRFAAAPDFSRASPAPDDDDNTIVGRCAGCFLVWVGVAVGALDFLGIVDAD